MPANEIPPFEFEPGARLYSVDEICAICQVTADSIQALVEYGVLSPIGTTITEWRFSMIAVQQTQRARRLQRDLEINWPGIALALDLIDDNARLRRELEAVRALLARFTPLS
jgi:chaperone modulatory protein CbpM